MKITKEIPQVKVPVWYKPNIKITGNVVEIKFCTTKNCKPSICKISKNEFIYLRDTEEHFEGEIGIYNHTKTRNEDIKNVFKTIIKCKDLINTNFFGASNELFITLTYAENMTDLKKLRHDMNNFIKNLKEKYKNQNLLYIYVVEPQERGAWHVHMLLKNLSHTSKQQWYVDSNMVRTELWANKGFVKIKKINNINDVGTYITTYLTNLKEGKKYSRLHLYPTGVRIYRHSQNVKKPIIEKNKMFDDGVNFIKQTVKLQELPMPQYVRTKYYETEGFEFAIAKIVINTKLKTNEKFNIEDYIDNNKRLSSSYIEEENIHEKKQRSWKEQYPTRIKEVLKEIKVQIINKKVLDELKSLQTQY